MKFRLIYEGPLKATQRAARGEQVDARAPHKNSIRMHFDAQLRQLWSTNRLLSEHRVYPSDYDIHRPSDGAVFGADPDEKISLVDAVREKHRVGSRAFVPLVRRQWKLHCTLEVLFLRPGFPGGLWGSGGDIDNRIKTLVDALRMPKTASELTGLPETSEPVFCLLEDDDLVTSLSVEADQLLQTHTMKTDDDRLQITAIISVEVRPYDATIFNLSFV